MKKDLDLYYKIINDTWMMLKHFLTHPTPGTNEYWTEVLAEGNRIIEAYNDSFSRQLVNAVMSVLEDRQKEEGERE